MPYFPLSTFAPDADPTTPGILKAMDGLLPTKRGFEGLPTGEATSVTDAVSETVNVAVTVQKLDASVRTFAGSSKALYEAAGTAWTDRSKSGGYTDTANDRWRFAQFGDTTYAATKANNIQKSASAAFDDETAAPNASIVAVVGNFNLGSFLMAFDTKNSSGNTQFGDSPDRWYNAAIGAPADWTPSIATQSASGRLTSSPGPIIGGHPVGDDAVAFKEHSLYLGRYMGPPTIWEWTLVSEEIGAPSHESVVNVGDRLMWPDIGTGEFYVYDGVRLAALPNELREFFFDEQLDQDYADRIVGAVDRENGRIVWEFPSNDSSEGTLDKYIAFHYSGRVPRWTVGKLKISFLLEHRPSSVTYDDLGASYSTYEDLPTASYDRAFVKAATPKLAQVTTGGKLETLTGTPGASQLTLWDMGAASLLPENMRAPRGVDAEDNIAFIDSIRPRFADDPAANVQLIHSSADDLGGDFASAGSSTSALSFGRFNVLRAARWHSERMEMSGSAEVMGVHVKWHEDGTT